MLKFENVFLENVEIWKMLKLKNIFLENVEYLKMSKFVKILKFKKCWNLKNVEF